MPKCHIYQDDAYEFGLSNSAYGVEVEVDAETLRRWKRVIEKHDDVQHEMQVAVEAAKRLAAARKQ